MSKTVLCPHCLGGKYIVEDHDDVGIEAYKCYLCNAKGEVEEEDAQIYVDKLHKNIHDLLNNYE